MLVTYIGCVGQGGEIYQRPIAKYDLEKGQVTSFSDKLIKTLKDGSPVGRKVVYQDSAKHWWFGIGSDPQKENSYTVFFAVEVDESKIIP